MGISKKTPNATLRSVDKCSLTTSKTPLLSLSQALIFEFLKISLNIDDKNTNLL